MSGYDWDVIDDGVVTWGPSDAEGPWPQAAFDFSSDGDLRSDGPTIPAWLVAMLEEKEAAPHAQAKRDGGYW